MTKIHEGTKKLKAPEFENKKVQIAISFYYSINTKVPLTNKTF